MNTIHFQTSIEAPASIVWEILWDPATYPKWTTPFSEGSYAVSDWKEGSSVSFLGADGGGIQSVIDKLEPNRLMRFRHTGVLKMGSLMTMNPPGSGPVQLKITSFQKLMVKPCLMKVLTPPNSSATIYPINFLLHYR